MEEVELNLIKKELKSTGGNISQAARNLDIPQQTLSHKIKRYKLERFVLLIKSLKFE